jgi:hypothetical protein
VRELVDDVEDAVFAPIMGAILDEVVGPDVVRVLRPQPDAGSVVEPEPATFGLFGRDLQALAFPDPLDPLLVHQPACRLQEGGDLTIAIPAIEPGQRDDVGRQLLLVLSAPRVLALCRAMLAERRTGATLGDAEKASDMLDAGAPARGA